MHGLILNPDAREATEWGMAAIGGTDQRHGQGLALKKGELGANTKAWPANLGHPRAPAKGDAPGIKGLGERPAQPVVFHQGPKAGKPHLRRGKM